MAPNSPFLLEPSNPPIAGAEQAHFIDILWQKGPPTLAANLKLSQTLKSQRYMGLKGYIYFP